jgi:hypothetical protein
MTALSVADIKMPPVTWHPWRALRAMTHVDIQWERMDGLLGTWDAVTSTITLHPDQRQDERRCTATHEAIHAEWGHEGGCDPKTELRVRKEAARRLIPIAALADALMFYGHDLHQVRLELWVDPETLRTRLDHLHPAERGYIRARMRARDEGAA